MKTKQISIIVCSCAISIFTAQFAQSQDSPPKSATDTLAPLVKQAQTDIKAIKKVKVSGYIQGQYQKAQSEGIESTSGPDFPGDIDQRFSIRRGRLKTTYTSKMSEAAVQFDFTVEGGVSLKEAYYKFTEPLLKTISLQAGLFNRPFGFEIGFSGTAMEAPERARVIQYAFPGETDLGVCLVIQLPKENPLSAFRIDAGLFNGTNNKVDYDNLKDFIGRLSYNNTFADKFITVGAGVSYYKGGTWNFAQNYYKWQDSAYVSTAIDSLGKLDRNYMGADIQLALDNSFGKTVLRAELVSGTQPSTSSSSKTQTAASLKPAYTRDFTGGYAYFVQSLGKTKHQFAAKYEWYDPNTAISKDQIGVLTPGGKANRTSKADIAYTTFGMGWIYNWDDNIKITAFYDMVSNEKTSLTDYTDELKDNVFTLRIQYKF